MAARFVKLANCMKMYETLQVEGFQSGDITSVYGTVSKGFSSQEYIWGRRYVTTVIFHGKIFCQITNIRLSPTNNDNKTTPAHREAKSKAWIYMPLEIVSYILESWATDNVAEKAASKFELI